MTLAVQIRVKNLMKRITDAVKASIAPPATRPVAMEAIDIIVKRTRLGYGVRRNYGVKEKFPTLSARYMSFRRTYRKLSSTTSPRKSNLTLTGQLLESIDIIKITPGKLVIGATKTRLGGLRNEDLVNFLQERHDRYFLRISSLEYKQLIRFYRKTFGDLLYKANLIR